MGTRRCAVVSLGSSSQRCSEISNTTYDQERAARALAKRARQLRHIVSGAPVALIALGHAGEVVATNPAAEALLKTRAQLLLGDPVWWRRFDPKVHAPGSEVSLERAVKRALTLGRSGEAEVWFTRGDGRRRLASVQYATFDHGGDGQTDRLEQIVCLRDVTDAAAAGTVEHASMPAPDEPEVLVVERHQTMRKGLELLLRAEGFRVAGSAGTVAEARGLLARRRHDIALIDISVEGGHGLELARERLTTAPTSPVVLYTSEIDQAIIAQAKAIGVGGLVHKGSSPSELFAALRRCAAGEPFVDSAVTRTLSAAPPRSASLSARERQVLELLAGGLTAEAVAIHLFLSPETVRTHVRNARRKLGAKTRAQAVALAVLGHG